MATDETTSRAVEQTSDRPTTAAEERAARHDGTTDTDTLVSDIEKTREELAETIDAIADKVNPKNVVDRGKQQAREAAKEGVQDAKEVAAAAAEAVKEKASTAAETVKEKASTAADAVKEKVSGGSDDVPARSPLTPVTSVEVGSATPVAAAPATPAPGAPAAGPSPLPADTVSVDAGALPPAEPARTSGALADADDRTTPPVAPAGGAPATWTAANPSAYEPSKVPLFAGAGAAAGATLLLLLLRRWLR